MQYAIRLGLTYLLASTMWAQAPNAVLLDLIDQVKAALQQGDLDAATNATAQLSVSLYKLRQATTPTPQEKLLKLEQAGPVTALERFYALCDLAKAAFAAGDMTKAEGYAKELLMAAPAYPKDWNYGNAVFFGNMVLGRVALRRDHNVESAKTYLLAAGHTTGSPQLGSFGPNMSLAKDLLAAGERTTVLEYFELCRAFWKRGGQKLDDWTAMVKGGGMPAFGANLVY